MYGLTEAFRSTYLPPDEVDRRPDSIGNAIPNAEILVLRADGTSAPRRARRTRASGCTGRSGLLERRREDRRAIQAVARARSPALMLPEIAVFSGDTVQARRGGISLLHRPRDEMIKSSGYRISPNEVEEVLYCDAACRRVRGVRRAARRRLARRWSWLQPPSRWRRGRRDPRPRAMPGAHARLHGAGAHRSARPDPCRAMPTARSIASRSAMRMAAICGHGRRIMSGARHALPPASRSRAIELVGRRHAAVDAARCARGQNAVLRLRPQPVARACRRLRAALPPQVQPALRDQGQPDAGLVRFMAAPGRRLRRRVGRRIAGRARRRLRSARDQLCRPRQERRSSWRRRSRPACWSTSSRRASCRALAQIARRLGLPARVAVRVNPDFELKSSGMKMGGGPKQFGIDAEAGAGGARRRSVAPGSPSKAFTSFRGSQNLRAEAICEAQRNALRAGGATGRARAGAGAIAQPRRRLRHSVLPRRASRSTWRRSATTCAASWPRRASACRRPRS